jgi:hypothetical protein
VHWRKSTWALILWTTLMALWEGYLGSMLNCAYADQACHAEETGNYTVVFFLWIFVTVPLAIFWYRSRPNKPRPCPACAVSVPAGILRCQRCGFDFAAAAAGKVVPVYSACWQCQAPVLQGHTTCGNCGAPVVWGTQPPSALGYEHARLRGETAAAQTPVVSAERRPNDWPGNSAAEVQGTGVTHCTNCGEPVPSGAGTCAVCGRMVSGVTPPSPASSMWPRQSLGPSQSLPAPMDLRSPPPLYPPPTCGQPPAVSTPSGSPPHGMPGHHHNG